MSWRWEEDSDVEVVVVEIVMFYSSSCTSYITISFCFNCYGPVMINISEVNNEFGILVWSTGSGQISASSYFCFYSFFGQFTLNFTRRPDLTRNFNLNHLRKS